MPPWFTHHDCDPFAGAHPSIAELYALGLATHTLMETIMPAIDDLKSAVADLATQLSANNAEIESLLTVITTPGTSEADIAAAAQSIRDLTAANKAEVDKAHAAVAPPAAPAP